MQVKKIDVVKRAHKTAPHVHEGRVIQITVIGDESQDAVAGLFDTSLGKANEFDVVVR